MIYFQDRDIDELLDEDISRGDLTTRELGLDKVQACMNFKRKNGGIVAGIEVAKKILQKLEIDFTIYANDGDIVGDMGLLIEAKSTAEKLHQASKVIQCVLEFSCGIASYTNEFVNSIKSVNKNANLLCTRKTIPFARKLSNNAVIIGGGKIHRYDLSQSILVFTNHTNLLEKGDDFKNIVKKLKANAPENKITIEADNLEHFKMILNANADIIQCDKFNIDEAKEALRLLKNSNLPTQLSIAGGINKQNAKDYAYLGIDMLISSAPYYAKPEDIKVSIFKLS